MSIDSLQYSITIQRKVFLQRNFAILHAVNIGTHFIHTVGRSYRNRIIPSGLTKDTIQ